MDSALSSVRPRAVETDSSTGRRADVTPLEATLRPADLKIAPLLTNEPSLGMRALRRMARFLMVLCIGVIATLAWQSYGGAAKQMMANWAQQRGWSSSSLPTTNTPPAGEIASEQPSPPAGEVP